MRQSALFVQLMQDAFQIPAHTHTAPAAIHRILTARAWWKEPFYTIAQGQLGADDLNTRVSRYLEDLIEDSGPIDLPLEIRKEMGYILEQADKNLC